MGYNNTTLTKSRFEMNSYSTQVSQLQFEYTYELDKICLVEQGMDQDNVQMIFDEWVWSGLSMMVMDRYDHKIKFYRRNYIEKNYRINSIMELLKFS
jgi:hypothetical protein